MSFNLEHLGKHIIIELYNCSFKILKNALEIEKIMNQAAVISKATVIKSVFHQFNPYGVSGVIIIAESHLTIHTWPEYGYASIDIYTCGQKINSWNAVKFLEHELEAKTVESFEIQRGIICKIRELSKVNINKKIQNKLKEVINCE